MTFGEWWRDGGINADGSLQPGRYNYGELPVVAWLPEDIEKVARWLEAKTEMKLSQIQEIVVDENGTLTVTAYHLDSAGNKHLVGHCHGESTQLAVTPIRSVLPPNKVEVSCVGCGRKMGQVLAQEAAHGHYHHLLSDHHDDVHVEEVVIEP